MLEKVSAGKTPELRWMMVRDVGIPNTTELPHAQRVKCYEFYHNILIRHRQE